jgi:hypothetical protein
MSFLACELLFECHAVNWCCGCYVHDVQWVGIASTTNSQIGL